MLLGCSIAKYMSLFNLKQIQHGKIKPGKRMQSVEFYSRQLESEPQVEVFADEVRALSFVLFFVFVRTQHFFPGFFEKLVRFSLRKTVFRKLQKAFLRHNSNPIAQ